MLSFSLSGSAFIAFSPQKGFPMNIYEIAELAGVSIATVSRVMNDSPLVSEKTKKKVRDVIAQNEYTPNVFARGLGLNSMETVGLICPDVADNYMAVAVARLERSLRECGYNCFLCCTGRDHDGCRKELRELLQKRIDAVVLIGSSYADDDPDSEKVEYIRQAASQIPVFMLNGYVRGSNIYCALCNDYESSYSAVSEMIASGRKKPLLLMNARTYSANQKRKGCEEALKDAGLPVEESRILYISGGVEAVTNHLLREQHPDIDAVFAANDILAIGALKYAEKLGLRVPEDLCILGYNNSQFALCTNPELSSIDSRVDRLCDIIVDTLQLRMKDQPVSSQVYAKGSLIRRGTTDF